MPALGGRDRATRVRSLPGECFLNARTRRPSASESEACNTVARGCSPAGPIRDSRVASPNTIDMSLTRTGRFNFLSLYFSCPVSAPFRPCSVGRLAHKVSLDGDPSGPVVRRTLPSCAVRVARPVRSVASHRRFPIPRAAEASSRSATARVAGRRGARRDPRAPSRAGAGQG